MIDTFQELPAEDGDTHQMSGFERKMMINQHLGYPIYIYLSIFKHTHIIFQGAAGCLRDNYP